ncbi:transcription factor BIM2-like isoform X1 [Oryza glaberrima]|uniref:transcription factor BIM2-like isoform X1 n=2 Tax=Oryza glaberrima TaxID=4538 RepID=UPI00224C06EB|nr:transcription factor BIM2-like isoform X1 [Oryza glaberrima]
MQLFQGEEPAHDFLSLRAGGGSSSPPFQHREEQHSSHSSRGYGMEIRRSLRPLELAKQRGRSSGNGTAAGSAVDGASPAGSDSEEHVLPGGVGTFSIRHASGTPSREEAGSHGGVRRSAFAFAPALHGARMENAHETGGRSGSRAHRAPSTMWQDSAIDQRSIGQTPYEATRAEGRSSASSADQGPSTPRSKHSATEQRRRTKINDRLEILRELLPHTDQKRDKASFLSEVIEYIRFLQEKVQKYEEADPERNHEDSKSMPWAKVYYRSCWRNTKNTSQVQGEDLSPSTQDMNNEQYGPKHISAAQPALFNTQSVTSTTTSSSHMATGTPQNLEKNSTPSNQPPWLSMSTMRQESEPGNKMPNKHEKQTLHDENHSISSAYSQGLFNRLTEALKKSGLDPSQANIAVEINLAKRARDNTSDNSKINEDEEPIQITKRRCNKS